jgi:hypothetical protein
LNAETRRAQRFAEKAKNQLYSASRGGLCASALEDYHAKAGITGNMLNAYI